VFWECTESLEKYWKNFISTENREGWETPSRSYRHREESDRQLLQLSWSDHHRGESDHQPLYIAHGLTATEVGLTASTSNCQISNLKVAVAIVMVWPPIELWSIRQVHRIFSVTSFWSVDYKYPFISCKISLLSIRTTHLTFLSPSLPHRSPYWSIVSVWGSSFWFEWFELCGTSDPSSKHHRPVTLGGCCLLDDLEEWKLWAPQEDCEWRSTLVESRFGEVQGIYFS
jgi:hypothetical protein